MAGWKFYLDNIEVEEPIGWDAIEFTAQRMPSHGIDQPFSTEVQFYDVGARYIKKVYDQHFINQPIAIKIVSDVAVNSMPYEFNGFLNLALYQERNVCDTDSFEVNVGIIDDDFREQFKARSDSEIDLTTTTDLNGDTIDPLTFKSIRLHRQELLLQANGKSLADRNVVINWYDAVIVPIYWQQKDFVESYGSAFDTTLTTINWNGGQRGQSPIFKNNASTTRKFNAKYSIKVRFENNNSFNSIDVQIYFAVNNGNVLTFPIYFVLFDTLPPNGVQTYDLTGVINDIIVPTGHTVNYAVEAGYTGNPNTAEVTIYEPATLNWSEVNPGEFASVANVLTIEQWLRRTIYVLTGDNNKLLSDAFSESGNGCYWNNALTNGLRIRNAEDEPGLGALNTSWKKVFEDLDKIFCLGWAFEWTGTDWKIRVEPREYFYQNVINETFTNVGEVTQMASVELLKNSITIGFTDKWKNIQLSGVYAIHTDRNYFADNRAMNEGSTAKLDLRSEIIAEGYAIEFSRRLSGISFGGATSDRPNDYETFIIWLNRVELSFTNIAQTIFNLPQESGPLTLPIGTVSYPSNYINTSNSQQAGLYNIFHTPARIAIRWWKIIGMHTYGLAAPKLRFQTGQYQTVYSSYIDDTIGPCQQYCAECLLEENADIDPDDLRDGEKVYLFRPIMVEFVYPQSLCDFLILSDQKPYGKIKMTSGSLTLSGYIQSIANKPEDNSGGTTSVKMLLSNVPDAQPSGRAYSNAYSNAYS